MLYRMLPTPEVAEEVLQDAFHSVWRQARTYSPSRGVVRVWLLAVIRNAAIDWRRTRGRRFGRESALEAAEGRAGPTNVEELVDSSLRSERVRAAIAALPTDQRDAVVLAFYGGFSQSEIARRLGAPLGTVKSRVRLGMARLRRSLAGEVTE